MSRNLHGFTAWLFVMHWDMTDAWLWKYYLNSLFFVALHKNQFKKKHKVTNNSTYFGSVYTCFLIPWSCKDSCVCWGSGADRSSEFAWTIHRDKGEPESKSWRKDWYLEREQSTRLQQLQQSVQVGVLECRAFHRNVWNICDAPGFPVLSVRSCCIDRDFS